MGRTLNVPYFKERNPKILYSLNRLKGMNMTQSALAAGYSANTANQACAKLEPAHNRRIKEAIEDAGATNDVLATVIVKGLSAERADGSVDYRERREHVRLALEAKGELKTGATVAVQINLPNGFLDAWGEEE